LTRSPGSPPAKAAKLDLSAKEFAVLEALLNASPGALRAERLLEQAWDENTDPFTNTVRVTIGRLKRKLEEPHVIQNTPGIGYRLLPSDNDPSFVSHGRTEPDTPVTLA
jgi:DNA-binding response OmpR family regulator